MKLHTAALMMTPGVRDMIADNTQAAKDVAESLRRHSNGDWGEVCQEDKELNDEAVAHGMRVLSAFNVGTGMKIWIITEADRSMTTILFPNEY